MLFTFPSRYLYTIGLQGVFSLAGWSRRIRSGFLVSRLTQDTALPHPLARTGLSPSAAAISNAFRFASSGNPCGPITPPLPKQRRFGLLPFRSPLLGESRLFSSPAGTKMFQFPAFACLAACRAFNAAGFPIRTPADQWSFAPTRGFSQLVASFIASWSLGIYLFARFVILLYLNIIYLSCSILFCHLSNMSKNLYPAVTGGLRGE